MQAKAKTTISSASRAGTGRSLSLQLSVAERFQTALFISATLHAIVLLGLQFRQPPPEAKQASSLNVVLVNSKSETRPDNAQALAQANLDGGGNTDEDRLAKSPVPVGNAEFKDGATPPPGAKSARKSAKTQSKPNAATPTPPSIRVPEPPAQQEAPVAAAAPSPVEAKSAPAEVQPSPIEPALPPELQAVAQQEAQARERVAELEREARELMTQLMSERAIEQPSTTFTVPPDYRPRPSETSDRSWPPSPPPSPAQSAARVVKVEPRDTATAHATIQAPPKETRTPSEAPRQPAPQIAANTGLKPTTAAEDAPTSATPELKAQTKLTQAPAPAPTPTPTVAPQPEVKVVRLENRFSTPEPPEFRPQTPPTPTQQAQAPTAPAPETREDTPASDPPKPPLPSASELMRRSSEIARLEAQIAKNYDEYQKRPRRKFVGARTAEFRFAQYIEEWRAKVERVGNTNYPEAAKQRRIYGSLQLTVAIRSDGAVESVEINRSSGQKVLDAAAIRIVELAGPYSHFPADISKDTDVLHITRTWTFTRGDQLVSE